MEELWIIQKGEKNPSETTNFHGKSDTPGNAIKGKEDGAGDNKDQTRSFDVAFTPHQQCPKAIFTCQNFCINI